MVNLFIKIGFPILSFCVLAFSIYHEYQILKEKSIFNSFYNLVTKFENNKLSLADIPKKQVEYFGYACLVNSLMIKNPEMPKYHADEINQYITTHEFNTMDSLIQYVKSLKDDVDKLFAIFSYVARNIKYDVDSYFSNDIKYTTVEETFKKKTAVCSGYSDLYLEIAKKVNLNQKRVKISDYSCFAKGYYDLILPENKNANHAIVFVEIDGIPFIIDATWGSGHINTEKVFVFNFDPDYFLIPFHKSLPLYYSNDVDKKILPYDYSFDLFHKSCKIELNKFDLKTESNPFKFLTCKNGHLELTYSCKGNNLNVMCNCEIQKSKKFESISVVYKIEIIENHLKNHPDRSRFKLILDFPEKGFYEVSLFINLNFTVSFYVNVFTKSNEIKEKIDYQKHSIIERTLSKFSKEKQLYIRFNLSSENRFFPIQPETVTTKVKSNGTLIRFVASKEYNIEFNIFKLPRLNASIFDSEMFDESSKKLLKEIILDVPYDDQLNEYQYYANFPSNGFYKITFIFYDTSNQYSYSYDYLFDVKGVKESNNQSEISPVDFLFEGRSFSPKKYFDENKNEIIIEPNYNSVLVNNSEQTIKIKAKSIKDKVYLEFRLNGSTLVWPKSEIIEGEFRQFKWSIPDELGEYHLLGWVNDYFFLDITYYHKNITLKQLTRNEKKTLAYMKKIIDSSKKLTKNR